MFKISRRAFVLGAAAAGIAGRPRGDLNAALSKLQLTNPPNCEISEEWRKLYRDAKRLCDYYETISKAGWSFWGFRPATMCLIKKKSIALRKANEPGTEQFPPEPEIPYLMERMLAGDTETLRRAVDLVTHDLHFRPAGMYVFYPRGTGPCVQMSLRKRGIWGQKAYATEEKANERWLADALLQGTEYIWTHYHHKVRGVPYRDRPRVSLGVYIQPCPFYKCGRSVPKSTSLLRAPGWQEIPGYTLLVFSNIFTQEDYDRAIYPA